MSRFRNLTHVLYHTKYHLVWTPKYRYRVLGGEVGKEVTSCIHSFMAWLGCEVIELNVQPGHVHMVAWILPKHSVSEVMGTVKGRTSIRVFKQFPWLRQRPYWGNHFWAQGYCVDTVGLDEEKIRLYVKWQEDKERRAEAQGRGNPRQGASGPVRFKRIVGRSKQMRDSLPGAFGSRLRSPMGADFYS